MPATVDNRTEVSLKFAKEVFSLCARKTDRNDSDATSYRWIGSSGNEIAYGHFSKDNPVVYYHGTYNYKPAQFTGDDATALKEVYRNVQETVRTPIPDDGKVTILWNGGWDDYKIDPKQVRDLTTAEITRTPEWQPTIENENGDWLKCSFIKQYGLGNHNQAVRILAHLGGGD